MMKYLRFVWTTVPDGQKINTVANSWNEPPKNLSTFHTGRYPRPFVTKSYYRIYSIKRPTLNKRPASNKRPLHIEVAAPESSLIDLSENEIEIDYM